MAERNEEVWQKETKMFDEKNKEFDVKKQEDWREETKNLAERKKMFGRKNLGDTIDVLHN